MRRTVFLIWMAAMLGLSAEPLKVMCWNIHHGVGEDGKLDLERIANRIKAEKPDLVALQEVDHTCGRSGKVDQAAELARLTGLHFSFGKAMDFDGGGYGLAVLSKLPIQSSQVHPLPGGGEPRIAFEVRLRQGDKEFSFVSVHLDYQDKARQMAQAKQVSKVLADRPKVMLCGDFNARPESETMKSFDADWTRILKKAPVETSPAAKPRSEIDFILLRGFKSQTPVKVLADAISSDHRPITGWVE